MAQLVKNLPSMQETWVQSLGWEDSLEKGIATHSSILAWRIPWTVSPWDSRESDTTERLSLFSQVKYIHFLCKQTRTFSSGKTEILPIQQQPPFLLSQFLVITILLSVSMILTTLGTSFQ